MTTNNKQNQLTIINKKITISINQTRTMGMKVKAVEKVADREIDISEMQAKI